MTGIAEGHDKALDGIAAALREVAAAVRALAPAQDARGGVQNSLEDVAEGAGASEGATGAPDLADVVSDMQMQRHLDNEPCSTCGGDRLRPDFVTAGRCHVPTKEGA